MCACFGNDEVVLCIPSKSMPLLDGVGTLSASRHFGTCVEIFGQGVRKSGKFGRGIAVHVGLSFPI